MTSKFTNKISFLILNLLISFVGYSQKDQDTLFLSGTNYGRNLIVLNPFNSDGVDFGVTEVRINNSRAIVNLTSTFFEIDFEKNQIKIGEKVDIKIIHSKTALPVIYNSECIISDKIELIGSLDSAKGNTNYALKDKSICILTGKLVFEKKDANIDDYWFGFEKLTKNSDKTLTGMGSPDENGRFIGVLTYDDTYSIDLDYFPKDKPTKIVYRFLVDLRGIPEDKKRGQVINIDIPVTEMNDERFYKFNEELPTKKLYYNSYYKALRWDKDYENAILKTTQALQKQIEQESNLKVLALEKDAEVRKKRHLYFIITLVAVTMIISFFAFLRQRKLRKEINKQKFVVEEQKHLVEEKQKEIIDSISYAKRLQEAILPPQEFINSHLTNNFIYYQPKDIVAGDFYWAEKINDLFFIAAADSTGHGVPGAMVSVVCSNALNRTVKEFGLTNTGKILDKTRELVVETFAKSNTDVKDGMDVSLLCIDKQNQKIFWSGANNPLWYIQDNELKEIKADKQPIGKTDNPKPFSTWENEYRPNTTFYLFTDGLADQFGGPQGKKFKYKQFEQLLVSINEKTMQEQAGIINQKFEDWKGELEQVDDVCVIGIKI
ncbi:MAG TPA: SpoIIE family protein phosphatase [Bacteroidia bacterium]